MSAQTAAVLRRARGLIATPDKWCQGKFRDCHAVCVLQAIRDAAGHKLQPLRREAERKDGSENLVMAIRSLARTLGSSKSIADWNDAPERTHDEVLAAVDAAIANEERQP